MTLDPTNIFGLVITIVALGFAIYTYFAAKREKSPCYGIRSEVLVEGYVTSLDGLSLKYNRKSVENLTISRVIFWNDGRETIESNDLATVNPLRIQALNESKILDAKLLVSNHQSNCFTCETDQDNMSVYLKFDYLDKGQGALFQVIHTGKSSRDIQLVGDIKGAPTSKNRFKAPRWVLLIEKFESLQWVSRLWFVRFLYNIAVVLSLAYLLLAGLVYTLLPYEILQTKQPIGLPFYRFQGVLYLVVSILIIYLSIQLQRIKLRVPKGLEVFFEDQFSTKTL